ncbi:MAG: Gfo/Idh/MocA family oxidoreductase [Acidobacteriota bacterium]
MTIVGAGLMGRWHARYAAKAGARIAAIVDPDLAAGHALARRFPGAAVLATLEESFRGPSDAVHVCGPAATHEASVRAALEAGRHVLVEKPLAPAADAARRLLELAKRRGRILSAVHQFPFQRGARGFARKREMLGTIVRLDFLLCSAGGTGLSPEDARESLLATLSHPVSLFRLCLAKTPNVSEWTVAHTAAGDIALSAACGEASLGVFLTHRGRPTRCRLDVLGSEASAHLDLFHGFSVIEKRRVSRLTKAAAPLDSGARILGTAAANLAWRAAHREPAFPGLPALVRAFYGAIQGGGVSPVSSDEILDAALLVDRVRREAEESESGSASELTGKRGPDPSF